jgi:hypothetical protein
MQNLRKLGYEIEEANLAKYNDVQASERSIIDQK